MAKLPSDLGAQMFSDSPLRSTTPVRKLPLAAVPTDSEVNLDSPVKEEADALARPAASAPTEQELPQQIKMTIYLSKEQVDAIEEEVFRRRRAGDRIGNTDLMREIVDAWRTANV